MEANNIINNLKEYYNFLLVEVLDSKFIVFLYKKNSTSLKKVYDIIYQKIKYPIKFIKRSFKEQDSDRIIDDYSNPIESYNLDNIVQTVIDYSSFDISKYEDKFQVFIKTLTGHTLTINASPEITTYELMLLIQDKHGTPPAQITIVKNGVQFELYEKIKKYNVKKEDTLHLILNLRGGMLDECSGRNGNFQHMIIDTIEIESDLEKTV